MEVTSIEQSKALLESGLRIESADLWWIQRYIAERNTEGKVVQHCVIPVTYLSFVNDSRYNLSQDIVVATPAWSLGKLLEMFNDKTFELNMYNKMWSASSGFVMEQKEHWTYQEFDETPIGAMVKLILKLKKEGIEI